MPTASGARTPKVKAAAKNGNGNADDADDAEGDEDDEDAMDVMEPVEEVKPVMYRWVSSLRAPVAPAMSAPAMVALDEGEAKPKGGEQNEKQAQISTMQITFSVPEFALAHHPHPDLSNSNSTAMQVDDDYNKDEESKKRERESKARGPGVCAVRGCGLPRKYRHPGDWTVGACGMGHLKEVGRMFERREVV